MHEGLIHGPVTQVLRKGELMHGEAYTQWWGGGGGAYRQRNTVYHKILIISAFDDCALPV